MLRCFAQLGLFLVGLGMLAGVNAPLVEAHAALERSEPAAGTSLPDPPAEIRLRFTEPLESAYTGADLLDGAGQPVPGVAVAISPDDDHELALVPATPLPEGNYTVAWRTLSAADGHTLQGYFGFGIGVAASGVPGAPPDATGNDSMRALSRGLALLGLAAVLAFAPVTMAVFAPAARATPAMDAPLRLAFRRYFVGAAVLAGSGSLVALAAQAVTVAPDASLLGAMAETLATRYGQLWLWRFLLLALVAAAASVALWGRPSWRRTSLGVGAAVSLAAPLPFSLISHAAAQGAGRTAAVAADALHLLAASIWAGGLFMLALVLLPAFRPLGSAARVEALRVVVPRFSVVGLAAWAVMVLSGLYSAWLQVGTWEALRTTAYGQSLALKLLLLVPVLLLAAWHLAAGTRGVTVQAARRMVVTLAVEAAIVVAVLLVVGRLIGLEPAREVLRAQTPTHLSVPMTFETDGGTRSAELTISPGAAGANDFRLEVPGEPLPEQTEGVLRFTPPDQSLGRQELILPMLAANTFHAQGSELALPGDWQVETIVRAIGDFSWSAAFSLPVGQAPPAAPEPNPAPLFAPVAVLGMVAIVLGALALAAAIAGSAPPSRRGAAAGVGILAVAVGSAMAMSARLPAPNLVLASAPAAVLPAPEATPGVMAHSDGHEAMADHPMDHHASPAVQAATPQALPRPGDLVQGEGLSIAVMTAPEAAGPVDIAIMLVDDDGMPLADARVAVLSDMPEMSMGRTETAADETSPGRYEAAFVPLGMPGEWRLTVRVSPRGKATQTFAFAVTVP